jgi:CxxC motif-containing protein
MTELICITCPKGCHLKVDEANDYAVTGNSCPRGEAYGKNELQHPVRVVTSTVRLQKAALPRLPVKTDKPLPKGLMFDCMKLLDDVTVTAPVKTGDVILASICGTDVNIVATRTFDAE